MSSGVPAFGHVFDQVVDSDHHFAGPENGDGKVGTCRTSGLIKIISTAFPVGRGVVGVETGVIW